SLDGEACTDGASCCSRECVPTIYGGHACQVASGCRVEGDACVTDAECCSFVSVGAGACVIATGQNIGRCRNPQGCGPEGNGCGGAPGSDGGGSARQDCCGCITPRFTCC